MKKYSNLVFIGLFGFMFYNFFLKNRAEADAKQSYEQFLSGKAVFIDVREEAEVKEGMVKGSNWFPLSHLQNNPVDVIKKIKQLAKNKSVFVYCRSGNRSGIVSNILKENGITAVNLGGYNSIINEKVPSQAGPIP